MHVIFFASDDFCIEDMIEAFQSEGHDVKVCSCSRDELLGCNSEKITNTITECKADIVFTLNYYPSIALVCKDASIRYISWVYDNPRVQLFSYTTVFPTNTIFVFEQDVSLFFQAGGIKNIHYLPMASNPVRLNKSIEKALKTNSIYSKPKEISFVGSLYTEEHQLYSRMVKNGISQYTLGYLRGIIKAQKEIYGCDIVTPSLKTEIISDMKAALPLEPSEDSVATIEYLFAKYVIDRQITSEERIELLSLAGKEHEVNVYTVDPNAIIPNCINHGPAHSDLYAPVVYRSSKINLNISLRSIINGIPLRAFEIMGSGGFLLTNYQAEFLNYFVPGEDFDYFDSPEDMLNKINYYLNHEAERLQIAENGCRKIKEKHTFMHRIKEMDI